jgi:hypothetical protein
MATTKKFNIVVLLTVIWFCLLLGFILSSGTAAKVGSNSLFPFALILFAFFPLYPLYRFAKRWPHLTLGIFMLGLCLLLTSVVAFAHYLLNFNGSWVQAMFDLSEILCVASSVLFVWQAARKHG